MKTIMEKYILTIIFMMFGISVNAKDAYYEMRDDASDFVLNKSDIVLIPDQTTPDNSADDLRVDSEETKEPAEAPSDGAVHTMTLYLLDGTQVTYNKDDLDNVTYLSGVGMKVYVSGTTTSVDYLYSQMTKIVYTISDSTPPATNNVKAK